MAVLTETKSRTEATPKRAEANTYGLPRGEALRRELVAVFREQRRAVLGFLRTGRKDSGGADGLPYHWPDWTDFRLGALKISERMTPLLKMTWSQAADKFAPRVGLDPNEWSVVNPHTERMIDDAALAFCQSTNETTSLQLDDALAKTREALKQGVVEKGESLFYLTKRVNKIFDGAETWRARRIAQTETSRAVHAAQEQAAIQSGVVKGWQWLLSSDACPICLAIGARARFVRLGQPFAVIGGNPVYSAIKFPPAHPHCNCTVLEILDDEAPPKWAETLDQPKPLESDLEQAVKPKKPRRIKPAPAPKKPRNPGAITRRDRKLLAEAEDQAGVPFTANHIAQGSPEYTTVVLDVAKVDRDLRRESTYVGPAASGAAIGGRYEEFQRFLARARQTGQAIEQPRAGISTEDGRITLSDGRHRFAVFRDEGQRLLPLSVRVGEASKLRKLYGPKA